MECSRGLGSKGDLLVGSPRGHAATNKVTLAHWPAAGGGRCWLAPCPGTTAAARPKVILGNSWHIPPLDCQADSRLPAPLG